MKRSFAIFTAFALLASPLSAEQQEAPTSPLPSEEELQRLGDMAQRWMRGFAEKMSPMVEQLKDLVGDLDAFEPPEMLENGDIIIRRKQKPDAPDEEAPSIEL